MLAPLALSCPHLSSRPPFSSRLLVSSVLSQEWNEIQYNGVNWQPEEIGAPGEVHPDKQYTFTHPRPARWVVWWWLGEVAVGRRDEG
jgi:hypothetical protein